MDSMSVKPGAALGAAANDGLSGALVETLICVVVAAVVLRLELHRRADGAAAANAGWGGGYAASCKRLLRECAPEAVGLAACLALAAALRARGDVASPIDDEAWANITREWPLLLTADTLLSLQAMLRLLVLLSVAMRAGSGSPVPLADETSALWFAGGLARVVILFVSKVYLLDGPLGGAVPAACEVAVVPLLLILGRGSLRRTPTATATVVLSTLAFAYRNRLCLANDRVADTLFLAAHCFDFLASFSYLLRTLLIEDGPGARKVHISVGFTHLLMPIQASLSTYYFLQAFDAVPELVGAGLPFEVLQIGNTAQLGAYLGAAALALAERLSAAGAAEAPQPAAAAAAPVAA